MENTSPPIFVVGAPRSGTTLVGYILDQHSRICMPGETHFFEDIYSRRHDLGDPPGPMARKAVVERLSTIYQRYGPVKNQSRVAKLFSDPAILHVFLETCTSYRDMLTYFMQLQMPCHARKTRWGNDVPKDIFHIKEVLSFYPDAKILICVRDPRDFILSYKNLWKINNPIQAARLKNLFHPVITAMLWKTTIKQIPIVESVVPQNNLMIIHYEKLVAEPTSTVKSMCEFLGEDFEETMLQVERNNSSFGSQEKRIYSTSVGRWRTQLSPEEAYVVQQVTRPELKRMGYARESIKVHPLKVAGIWATLPGALWRAIAANKRHRGPLLPYVARRIAALFS